MGNRLTTPSVLHSADIPGSRLRFIVDNMPGCEIRPSKVHGNGLFAVKDFASGAVLGLLDGQMVDWASFNAAEDTQPYGEHGDNLFVEWNALSPEVLLIRPFRTKYSFINHSRNPNVCLLRDPLRVVATRAVAAGEELTLDYRREPLRKEYLEKAEYL